MLRSRAINYGYNMLDESSIFKGIGPLEVILYLVWEAPLEVPGSNYKLLKSMAVNLFIIPV